MEQRKHVVVVGEDDEPIARLLGDAINDEPAYQAVIAPDGARVQQTMPVRFLTAASQHHERTSSNERSQR